MSTSETPTDSPKPGPHVYMKGDIVWTKLGSSWWPGEVKNQDELPTDLNSDFKRPPLVIVKFFDEDSYEYVKNWSHIYPYNCDKKVEFIRKGMAAFRNKAAHMEKFPKDVTQAEEKTGGNPNILSDTVFLPQKKFNYSELFGTSSPSPKKSKFTTSTRKSYSKNSNLISHRRFLGHDDYRAFICIQYPGKFSLYDDEEGKETFKEDDGKTMECKSCGFSTKRLGVMMIHAKMHINSAQKKKLKPARKKKDVKKKDTFTDLLEEWSDEDQDAAKENNKEGKERVETPVVEKKPPRTYSKKSKKEFSKDKSWEDPDMAEVFKKDKKNEKRSSKKKDKSEKKSQSSEPSSHTQEDIKNCFDFDEEEEVEDIILSTTPGRKIPRVIPEKTKSPRTEELQHTLEDDSTDISREEILRTSQSFNKTNDDKDTENLEDIFKEVMEETSLPQVERLLNNFKPEQNFHDGRTVKKPDKSGPSENEPGKSVTPKRKFVKSFEDFEIEIHNQKSILENIDKTLTESALELSKPDSFAAQEDSSNNTGNDEKNRVEQKLDQPMTNLEQKEAEFESTKTMTQELDETQSKEGIPQEKKQLEEKSEFKFTPKATKVNKHGYSVINVIAPERKNKKNSKEKIEVTPVKNRKSRLFNKSKASSISDSTEISPERKTEAAVLQINQILDSQITDTKDILSNTDLDKDNDIAKIRPIEEKSRRSTRGQKSEAKEQGLIKETDKKSVILSIAEEPKKRRSTRHYVELEKPEETQIDHSSSAEIVEKLVAATFSEETSQPIVEEQQEKFNQSDSDIEISLKVTNTSVQESVSTDDDIEISLKVSSHEPESSPKKSVESRKSNRHKKVDSESDTQTSSRSRSTDKKVMKEDEKSLRENDQPTKSVEREEKSKESDIKEDKQIRATRHSEKHLSSKDVNLSSVEKEQESKIAVQDAIPETTSESQLNLAEITPHARRGRPPKKRHSRHSESKPESSVEDIPVAAKTEPIGDIVETDGISKLEQDDTNLKAKSDNSELITKDITLSEQTPKTPEKRKRGRPKLSDAQRRSSESFVETLQEQTDAKSLESSSATQIEISSDVEKRKRGRPRQSEQHKVSECFVEPIQPQTEVGNLETTVVNQVGTDSDTEKRKRGRPRLSDRQKSSSESVIEPTQQLTEVQSAESTSAKQIEIDSNAPKLVSETTEQKIEIEPKHSPRTTRYSEKHVEEIIEDSSEKTNKAPEKVKDVKSVIKSKKSYKNQFPVTAENELQDTEIEDLKSDGISQTKPIESEGEEIQPSEPEPVEVIENKSRRNSKKSESQNQEIDTSKPRRITRHSEKEKVELPQVPVEGKIMTVADEPAIIRTKESEKEHKVPIEQVSVTEELRFGEKLPEGESNQTTKPTKEEDETKILESVPLGQDCEDSEKKSSNRANTEVVEIHTQESEKNADKDKGKIEKPENDSLKEDLVIDFSKSENSAQPLEIERKTKGNNKKSESKPLLGESENAEKQPEIRTDMLETKQNLSTTPEKKSRRKHKSESEPLIESGAYAEKLEEIEAHQARHESEQSSQPLTIEKSKRKNKKSENEPLLHSIEDTDKKSEIKQIAPANEVGQPLQSTCVEKDLEQTDKKPEEASAGKAVQSIAVETVLQVGEIDSKTMFQSSSFNNLEAAVSSKVTVSSDLVPNDKSSKRKTRHKEETDTEPPSSVETNNEKHRRDKSLSKKASQADMEYLEKVEAIPPQMESKYEKRERSKSRRKSRHTEVFETEHESVETTPKSNDKRSLYRELSTESKRKRSKKEELKSEPQVTLRERRTRTTYSEEDKILQKVLRESAAEEERRIEALKAKEKQGKEKKGKKQPSKDSPDKKQATKESPDKKQSIKDSPDKKQSSSDKKQIKDSPDKEHIEGGRELRRRTTKVSEEDRILEKVLRESAEEARIIAEQKALEEKSFEKIESDIIDQKSELLEELSVNSGELSPKKKGRKTRWDSGPSEKTQKSPEKRKCITLGVVIDSKQKSGKTKDIVDEGVQSIENLKESTSVDSHIVNKEIVVSESMLQSTQPKESQFELHEKPVDVNIDIVVQQNVEKVEENIAALPSKNETITEEEAPIDSFPKTNTDSIIEPVVAVSEQKSKEGLDLFTVSNKNVAIENSMEIPSDLTIKSSMEANNDNKVKIADEVATQPCGYDFSFDVSDIPLPPGDPIPLEEKPGKIASRSLNEIELLESSITMSPIKPVISEQEVVLESLPKEPVHSKPEPRNSHPKKDKKLLEEITQTKDKITEPCMENLRTDPCSNSYCEENEIILPFKKSRRVTEPTSLLDDDFSFKDEDTSSLQKNITDALNFLIEDTATPQKKSDDVNDTLKSLDENIFDSSASSVVSQQEVVAGSTNMVPQNEVIIKSSDVIQDELKKSSETQKGVPPKKKKIDIFLETLDSQKDSTTSQKQEIPQPPKKKLQKFYENSQVSEKSWTSDMPLMSPLIKKKSFTFHEEAFNVNMVSESISDNLKTVVDDITVSWSKETPKEEPLVVQKSAVNTYEKRGRRKSKLLSKEEETAPIVKPVEIIPKCAKVEELVIDEQKVELSQHKIDEIVPRGAVVERIEIENQKINSIETSVKKVVAQEAKIEEIPRVEEPKIEEPSLDASFDIFETEISETVVCEETVCTKPLLEVDNQNYISLPSEPTFRSDKDITKSSKVQSKLENKSQMEQHLKISKEACIKNDSESLEEHDKPEITPNKTSLTINEKLSVQQHEVAKVSENQNVAATDGSNVVASSAESVDSMQCRLSTPINKNFEVKSKEKQPLPLLKTCKTKEVTEKAKPDAVKILVKERILTKVGETVGPSKESPKPKTEVVKDATKGKLIIKVTEPKSNRSIIKPIASLKPEVITPKVEEKSLTVEEEKVVMGTKPDVIPPPPTEAEMVEIEENLIQTISQKELADAQVTITPEQVISEKKPVGSGNLLSMVDFSESSNSSVELPDKKSERGTEFSLKAITNTLETKIPVSKSNTYGRLELLDILEGNSNSNSSVSSNEQFKKSFIQQQPSVVEGIQDFEESIPCSAIVLSKKEPLDLAESSTIRDSPKLLERLSQPQKVFIQSDIKVKEAPKTLKVTPKLSQPQPTTQPTQPRIVIKSKPVSTAKSPSRRPIILSEQIIRPATIPSANVANASAPLATMSALKRPFEDIEDIEEPFIITKTPRVESPEFPDEPETSDVKEYKSKKPRGRAKILQHQIITPQGKLFQTKLATTQPQALQQLQSPTAQAKKPLLTTAQLKAAAAKPQLAVTQPKVVTTKPQQTLTQKIASTQPQLAGTQLKLSSPQPKLVTPQAQLATTQSKLPTAHSQLVASQPKGTTQLVAASLDEAMFDINSMPIVLSDELLTPESIEKMPVVLSGEIVGTATSKKGGTSLVKEKAGSAMVKEKTVSKLPPKKAVMAGISTPRGKFAALSQIPHIAVAEKAKPKAGPTLSKLPVASGLLTTPGSKNTKFLLVPSTATGQPTQKIVGTMKSTFVGTPAMTPASLAVSKQSQSTVVTTDPTNGSKIMIVTNQQGEAHRLLLTPTQQKMLGMQGQPVKDMKTIMKGPIPKGLLSEALPSTSGLTPLSPTITAPQPQHKVLTPHTTAAQSQYSGIPRSGMSIPSIRSGSIPSRRYQGKQGAGKQKTILIKNQLGQTVKKIQGTDDDDLDRQVAEQLAAIKASTIMQAQAQRTHHEGNQRNPASGTPTSPKAGAKATTKRATPKKLEAPIKNKLAQAGIQPPHTQVPQQRLPEAMPTPAQAPQPTLAKKSSTETKPAVKEERPVPTAITTEQPVVAKTEASHQTADLLQAAGKPASDVGKPADRPLQQLVIQDAMGNQTTITEGQILALPSETVDGQPQSYMLITLDESGNLTPLNNEALMSLDPSLGLGGDISNMVLQVDQGQGVLASASAVANKSDIAAAPIITDQQKVAERIKGPVIEPMELNRPEHVQKPSHKAPETSKSSQKHRTAPESVQKLVESEPSESVQQPETTNLASVHELETMLPELHVSLGDPPSGDPSQGQQLIVTGDQGITQKFLESLSDGSIDLATILTAETGSVLIQIDGQQILIRTHSQPDSAGLIPAESNEGSGNPIFSPQHKPNQDILAAALANTDVFQGQDSPTSGISKEGLLPPGADMSLSSGSGTLYPMHVGNVLETSLTLSSPIMTPLEAPSIPSKKIVDKAEVLNQVPKNVDLPITITDPNISQTVAHPPAALLELSLPLSDSPCMSTSSQIESQIVYPHTESVKPLNLTSESGQQSQKSYNCNMPLLTDDMTEEAVKKTENRSFGAIGGNSKEDLNNLTETTTSSTDSLLDAGLCTLGGAMCSSLSEPPPDMFELPEKEEEISSDQSNSVPEAETLSLTSDGSGEIPLQPQIVAKLSDIKRLGDDSDSGDTSSAKRAKYD